MARIGLVAAILMVASGCGVAMRTAPTVKTGSMAAHARAVIGMKQAFQSAAAFAKTTYGDDFRPLMAFADQAFDKDGNAQPTTWRFNLVGHLRGQAGFSLVKVQIKPDGTPFVDPQKGGPFPDRNNDHQLPQLDLANVVDPDTGWGIVLSEGYGKKYPPSYPVSWEVRPSDRLKQTVMTFRWVSNRDGGTKWYVETSLNPLTGEVVENDAAHT
jgi:hypothetical protein